MGTIAEKLAKIEETKAALKSAINGIGNIVGDVFDEYPTAISSGKSAIAAAITGKGVATAATNTFAQMATNIGEIGDSPFVMPPELDFETVSSVIMDYGMYVILEVNGCPIPLFEPYDSGFSSYNILTPDVEEQYFVQYDGGIITIDCTGRGSIAMIDFPQGTFDIFDYNSEVRFFIPKQALDLLS